ncbi:hypothetical protein PHSY_004368 [Pseudozyma hubeiensis SY62]|uniref:Uncharacterized protein n=1 Tax=Pseudozyma hubeiensis (strain SY62) TaxID=1305764 RepID=R9P622_PSEHS|nr:hypothetical protein PHSY_004368 [Pseudozyma hubeiensis SY62]GAC96784.1 hypothetical protein PHSY_004368 [Pseudozyma hubeiensis SY62]
MQADGDAVERASLVIARDSGRNKITSQHGVTVPRCNISSIIADSLLLFVISYCRWRADVVLAASLNRTAQLSTSKVGSLLRSAATRPFRGPI